MGAPGALQGIIGLYLFEALNGGVFRLLPVHKGGKDLQAYLAGLQSGEADMPLCMKVGSIGCFLLHQGREKIGMGIGNPGHTHKSTSFPFMRMNQICGEEAQRENKKGAARLF